jgi:hypothetical protein
MLTQNAFSLWLLLWTVCGGFALWSQRKGGAGAGLTISYILQLWILHWLGAAIYALPWYLPPTSEMSLGLQQSTYAIAGFAIGCGVILPALLRKDGSASEDVPIPANPVDPKLVRTCLIVGSVMYFGLEPILHPIPTLGAIAGSTSNLLLVALAMECWNGLQQTGTVRKSFWRWVLLSAALPVTTIVTKGFLGYGFSSMLTIFCFVASFYRPRWKIVAWSVVIGYLALSLYVTYMRDRRDIRAVVWTGQDYSTRFTAMSRTFLEFEFLDLQNVDHLARIDDRLNQNYLVGRSVEFLNQNPELYARGRTLWEAASAPIPRFIWRDKPTSAGSGDLVSEFTGLHFAKGTSVGIGHVLEWYVNFGSIGVFLGMMGIGVLLGWIDRMAARGIHEGDAARFVLWWLPGLSLLQVGGSLVEAVGSGGAGLVIGLAVRSYQRNHSPHPRLDLAPASTGRYPSLVAAPKPPR